MQKPGSGDREGRLADLVTFGQTLHHKQIVDLAMPLYEYLCGTCGRSFEMLRRMQEADCDLECPECKSRR